MGINAKKFVSVCCLALFVGALALQSPAAAVPKGPVGLEVLGLLPNSQDEPEGFVVGINDRTRRMYYMNREGPNFLLREYDVRTEMPRLIREELMGNYGQLAINYYSPYTVVMDEKRNLLIVLSQTGYGSALKFIDLKTLKFVGTWDVGTILPGFVGQGIATSPRDGRIYLLGSQAVNVYGTANTGQQKPAHITMVAALEARLSPQDPPELVWARPVPECQQVMDTKGVGALIARSQDRPALYFACIRANPYPGESGLVRLWISKGADQADALDFDVDFFPVSGSFTHQTNGIVGLSGFDPVRERFFVQSQSASTPGAWVFDGKLSAWVGFIVSPNDTNLYLGLDTDSGHYYMGVQNKAYDTGFVVVSDASQTPVSQGEVVAGLAPRGFIVVDERTHRLFLEVDLKAMGLYEGDEPEMFGFIVVRDQTTIAKPQKPVDYDELTSEMNEGPGVATSFSGGVNGYGSRMLLVGGYGGVISATGQRPTVGSFRPGDRGVTAARVPSVDIRSAGASASAQGLVPDANTEGDLDDVGAGAWPWTPATCLDGGGVAQTNNGEGPNSSTVVTCDLAKSTSEASSSWGAVTAEGLSVGGSSFSARARRDAKMGAVTDAVAEAHGIEVAVPGGGTLSIANVSATSTTVAHGRSGSAEATYERKIIGIELTDAEGNVVQRIGECGAKADVTCRDAIEQINRAVPMKLRVDLPEPVITGTPKGAFAGVFLSEGDFIEAQTMNNQGSTFEAESASRAVPALQISLYNDSEEKSRVVTQLAAIEANSIYTNTPIDEQDVSTVEVPVPEEIVSDPGPSSPVSGLPSASVPSLGASGGSDLDAAPPGDAGAPVAAAAPPPAPVKGVLAFLSRSPGSALLVASVWMTFLSAGVAALRRRSLLALLFDGGGTE